jgi:drug/metabolite transporter (DMT)-like permease
VNQPAYPQPWVAITEVILAVIFWGASFIATKVALEDVSPVTVVWLRFLIGVVVLGIAVMLRQQAGIPGRKDMVQLAGLGFIGITFHQWLQSTGLQTAQASTTAWIVATTPIFMAILGWLFLKEKLTQLQLFGIILAALGVVMVVTRGDLGALQVGDFGTPGDILILVSAPNWAIFSALSRRSLAKFPATQMIFFVMVFGWLFTSVFLISGPGLSEIVLLSTRGWAGILFLGVACSGLAYIFWYDGLKAIPASRIGAFLYLEPLVAVILALMVLGEPVLISSALGGAAILLGVWFVNRD